MSVGQAISHPLEIHRIGTVAERKARVLDLMERVGLSPGRVPVPQVPAPALRRRRASASCSRGPWSPHPDFVVADEPIAMADVSVRALILQLMQRMKDEMGLTYLFITHDLATAKYLCDRIAIMYLGRIVELAAARSPVRPARTTPTPRPCSRPCPCPTRRPGGTRTFPRGKFPAPSIPPQGCHFHPRCPFAMPRCSEARPPLKEVAPGHYSACLLE